MPRATSHHKPSRRHALRRALVVLVAGFAAMTLGWAGPGAVAQAEEVFTVDSVVVRSVKAEAWSSLEIDATWLASAPREGQSFTIALGDGLRWPAALNFPLVDEQDPSVSVGDCVVGEGASRMVCTLNAAVEQWSSATGSLTATAQMTDALVGATSSSMVVAGRSVTVVPGDADGDGACDAGCGGVLPQQANPSTYKVGWLAEVAPNGTYSWTWDVNVHGSTQYTVLDEGVVLEDVQCTTSDWSAALPVTPDVAAETGAVSWEVDSPDAVCRARFSSSGLNTSVTNTATVNGVAYTAAAEAWSLGSGSVTGTIPQTPTPSEQAAQTPSAPVETGENTLPGQPLPSTEVTVTVVAPAVPTEGSVTTGTSPLARTGSIAGMAAMVGIVILAAGVATLLIVRRRG